jgi:hypothetical protein
MLDLFSCNGKIHQAHKSPQPTWLRFVAVFLCSSSLVPYHLTMHKESCIGNVKQQIREYLRCSVATLSLYLADGTALSDGECISSLGIRNKDRIYCRIDIDPPKIIVTTPEAAVAVRQQIAKAEETWSKHDGSKAGSKRKRETDLTFRERFSKGQEGAKVGIYLGLRSGFLNRRGRRQGEEISAIAFKFSQPSAPSPDTISMPRSNEGLSRSCLHTRRLATAFGRQPEAV